MGRAALLDRARRRLAEGGSVLLCGPAGIGKSTLLSALAAEATDARILRASAVEVESGLPYLTLVDLFDGVTAEEVAALPRHLRAALEAALLRGADPAGPHDQLAVRLAVLELLRALAANRPVVMVIDDLQWVDEPSAGVLRFVARRLAGTGVRVLAAERSDADTAFHDLCPPPCDEIPLPPLTEYDTADLLRAEFGPVLSLLTIARVHEACGGNPLFTVELGRALVVRGGSFGLAEPLPVPDRLRPLLSERLASLPPASAPVLLLIAAAARPTRTLLGDDHGARNGLDAAVTAGLVTVEHDGAVRFSHPLLREMVYAEADEADRRDAHAALARRSDDLVEQARHLALAQPYPDTELAERLAAAAQVAKARGAPAVAADLTERAADREPEPGLAAARRLDAANLAWVAGQTADTDRLARAALRGAASPQVRVGARLLLIELAGRDRSGVAPQLDAAFAEAEDDPGLIARVRLYRADKAYYDGDMEHAIAELKLAEEAAELAQDTERQVEILTERWSLERSMGGPDSDRLLRRAEELARDLPLTSTTVATRRADAVSLINEGRVTDAVARIDALRTAVERSGTVRDLAEVLWSVASVYTRAGRCAEALTAGRECMRLMLDMGSMPGLGLLVGGLVEMYGGSTDRAAALVDDAIAASVAAGDEDWLRGAYATRGQIHLLEGAPAAAIAPMRDAYALEQRMSRVDPALFLWHADFVEALTAAGERAQAAELLAEVRDYAQRLGRTVVSLGLNRAGALLRAAGGDIRGAADGLADALAEQADHPYPLELARAWQTLAALERRAHRRGAARAALAEAVTRYRAAGAAPWLAAAEAELARLDGGRGAGLSETERRIVELVRAGATNREIARATFLSVKAVEANLTRLYRRLGVRNRAQLVRALDSDRG